MFVTEACCGICGSSVDSQDYSGGCTDVKMEHATVMYCWPNSVQLHRVDTKFITHRLSLIFKKSMFQSLLTELPQLDLFCDWETGTLSIQPSKHSSNFCARAHTHTHIRCGVSQSCRVDGEERLPGVAGRHVRSRAVTVNPWWSLEQTLRGSHMGEMGRGGEREGLYGGWAVTVKPREMRLR